MVDGDADSFWLVIKALLVFPPSQNLQSLSSLPLLAAALQTFMLYFRTCQMCQHELCILNVVVQLATLSPDPLYFVN